MAVWTGALFILFITSLLFNAYLLSRIKKTKSRPQSVELKEFLADLMTGAGIVAVGRIDPTNILLRSPKK